MDWTAVLIVTGVCVVTPVMIVSSFYRSKNHEVDRKMDVLSKAIENGQDIDPGLFTDEKSSKTLKMRLLNKLTWGAILLVISVGMFIGSAFMYGDEKLGMIIPGSFFAAIGAGLLAYFFIGKKWMTPEIEADEARQESETAKHKSETARYKEMLASTVKKEDQ